MNNDSTIGVHQDGTQILYLKRSLFNSGDPILIFHLQVGGWE